MKTIKNTLTPHITPHIILVESAVANALDAKKAWIEAALEEGSRFMSLIVWMIIPDNSN